MVREEGRVEDRERYGREGGREVRGTEEGRREESVREGGKKVEGTEGGRERG